MEHGGILEDYSKDLLDFSTNINPLGYPDGVEEAIGEGVLALKRYPDLRYRELKTIVSEYLGGSAEQTSLGCGSIEIIDALISLYDRIIISEPCFSEYRLRSEVRNKIVESYPLDKILNEPSSLKLDRDTSIILGNPNNPTGKRISKEKLLYLYKEVANKNSYLILDEAFFEFSSPDYDSVELFTGAGFSNVAIIRASTKFFGLPGLRFGYALSEKEIAERIDKIKLPWSLNAFVLPVARLIFKDKEFITNSKEFFQVERDYLKKEYKTFSFLKMLDTDCNFYLLKFNGVKASFVFDELLKRGILTRKTENFNLEFEALRLAIKSREDNLNLLKALKDIEKGLIR